MVESLIRLMWFIKNTMNKIFYIGGIILISLFLYQCKHAAGGIVSVFEHAVSPADNPITKEKVKLGRELFFDKRLSRDESISCASCHLPELAFTDGKVVSEGVGGLTTQRNSPSILNSAYLTTVMYDAHLPTLEQQVIVPIQEHVEMDMNMLDLITKMRGIPEYQNAAKNIFNREFDAYVLTRAISAYERTLISDNSAFDQYYYQGNKKAISNEAERGWKLFSERLYCTECHPAPYFTTHEPINNGLYADYGEDKGRFRIFSDSMDIGQFKVPSLRNLELTGPYMHDGSLSTITDVINHYKGGGKGHRLQDERIVPFEISDSQTQDLIAFLNALTDTTYMVDYR